MKFIKEIFHWLTNCVARPLAKAMTNVIILITPVRVWVMGLADVEVPSFKYWLHFFAGLGLLCLTVLASVALTVFLIAGLTFALALVVPIIIANAIAILGTVLFMLYAVETAHGLQPDCITVEII